MAFSSIRSIYDFPKLILRSAFTINKNGMSVFTPFHVEPIFKKEKLQELIDSGEAVKRASVPVKPPHGHETCSEYFDEIVSRFTNYIMKKGNKTLARQIVEKTLENIKRLQIERYHLTTEPEEKAAIELDPKKILHQAIINSQPLLQLTPIKRGGVKYQVPMPITEARSRFMAQQWIIDTAKDRDRKKFRITDQLAWELIDAANNRGRVVKRKQDLHKQCEANRAYAHYRWS